MVIFISLWEGASDAIRMASLAFFLLIYGLNGHASGDWKRYLRKNWLDLFLIVLVTMPLLRLLVLLNLSGLIPAIRIGAVLHLNRRKILDLIVLSQESFPVAMGMICGLIFIFGISTYAFEHGHNPSFDTVDNALWWAIVTLTTVGYGDITPITAGGRIIAVMNMIFGILIYSLAIANFTRLIEEHSELRKQERKAKNHEP